MNRKGKAPYPEGASSHPSEADRLHMEQIKLLYTQAPAGLLATLVNSVVLTLVLWKVIASWKLILWLGSVLLAVWLRHRLVKSYRKSSLEDTHADRWTVYFMLGLLASGVLMGSAGIFLFPYESLAHEVFLAFLLGGMVAGATGTYSVMLRGFLLYTLPIIAPITVQLLRQGTEIEVAIGGLLVIFYAIMVNTAYYVHKTTIQSLRLRFENSELVADLMVSKSKSEQAIETLQHEVSERKNAEKALRESEQLFRMLVETMNEALGLQDDQGIITYVNGRFCQMLGYSRAELLRLRMLDLFDAANRAKYEEQIAERRLGTQTSYEIEMLKKNGESIPIIISASPVFDEHGEFAGTIAAITDISVLKRAGRELLESEEKYRMIFENSPLGIVHFDPDGTITAYNENLARMSDTSREEFIGLNPLTYLQDEEMKSAIAVCLSGKQAHYDGYYLSRRTGKVTPIKADFSPIVAEDGTVLGGTGIIQDISEEKRAQKKLGDQLHFLQTLIDTIPNPIFYKDTNGLYVGCNKAFEVRLGLNREQIVGKSVYDVLPRDLAEEYSQMDSELFRNPGEQVYETSLVYSDGKRREIILNKATYSNVEGALAGLVGVSVDITGRKRAEEALRRAHDELEMRVRERTSALAAAVEDLQNEISERKKAEEALLNSSEKLKLFAYSVIHDLKSPAIGIYGVAKLLHKHYENALDEKGRMYCEQILKASEHVALLVEQINMYVAAKEAPVIIERLNVNEILRMVHDEFSTQLSLRQVDWVGLDVRVEIDGDRLSIHRVFRNLVDNALKYGGERLSEIRVGYQEDDDFFIFSVADDGVGVSTEDSERIFGLFKRDKTSRGISGTGLGLAIVKEISERHGGEVWVVPGPQRGTTFFISIAKRLDI
ncbi:MAG: PAS domain S-box protein [Desulfoferrobacter sp.]